MLVQEPMMLSSQIGPRSDQVSDTLFVTCTSTDAFPSSQPFMIIFSKKSDVKSQQFKSLYDLLISLYT